MKESGGEQAAADEQENNSLTSVFELWTLTKIK